MSSFLPTNLAENGDGAEFFGALTDALSALTSSVGWVASRAMDTVNGAVEHAEDGDPNPNAENECRLRAPCRLPGVVIQ